MKRFVILDRDGTLIVDRGYLGDLDGVELLPHAAEGLRELQALGLGLIVATNQSGVVRGFFDTAAVDAVHARLRELLLADGIVLDGIYVCPHGPDGACSCRKPLAGLVRMAADQLGFDPSECFVVGDKPCDIGLGKAIGAVTVLVEGLSPEIAAEIEPDYVVPDLVAAAIAIRGRLSLKGQATRAEAIP